jgi:hypothetical protein
VAGADELAAGAVRAEVAALKAELLGPAPSVTDKVLAGAVVVAHLGHQRAALAAAQPADKPGVREARERLLTIAQRRLQDALKGWELHAGKKAKGLRLRGRLKLSEPGAAG